MNRFIWSGTKARGTEEGAHRGELIVALASKPVRAQRRPVRTDLEVAAGDVVGGHEARHVLKRALGLDPFSLPADGECDLRLPIDLLHAEREFDLVERAGKTARRLQEEIRQRR